MTRKKDDLASSLFDSLELDSAGAGAIKLEFENALPVEATLDSSSQTEGTGAIFNKLKGLLGKRKHIGMLKSIDLFKDLDLESMVNLAEVIEEHTFPKGSYIIQKGKLGKRMFFLSEGTVAIPIVNKATQQRYQIQLGPGEIFGEMALLTGEPRNADVFAVTDCNCFALKRNDVEDLMYESPEIARLLTSILGKRLVASKEIQQVGQYKLLDPLGKGGMATVYAAMDTQTNKLVAIKMLSHELVLRGNFAEQFRAESELLGTLRHPHIVDFIDSKEAYRTFFIIMEKLSGDDLNKRIAKQGRLLPNEAHKVIVHVAQALEYAHNNGIIHRDLKASNIMFDDHGNAKLADFGLALHESDQSSHVGQKGIEGTPIYMAPEQITHEPLDGRTDIYALGICAFKMLTGVAPFRGDLREVLRHHLYTPIPSLMGKIPDLTDELDTFIQTATQKDPAKRFQNAREILELFGDKNHYTELAEFQERSIKIIFAPRQEALVNELIEEAKERIKDNMEVIIY